MSLPKITLPEYTVQLQSVKDPVRFRPYTVKEEKIFLIAKESNDVQDMERAVRQVLSNCTFDTININALPSFDLEYLFLQIRAKSVNNVVELQYRCRKLIETDKRCDALVKVAVPLDQIQFTVDAQHTNIVKFASGMSIELQYPTLVNVAQILQNKMSSIDQPIAMIRSSIKQIVDTKGDTYEAQDYSEPELTEFVESLSFDQIQQIQKFFDTMPRLTYDTEFVCPKCQYREPIHFEGLADFFD